MDDVEDFVGEKENQFLVNCGFIMVEECFVNEIVKFTGIYFFFLLSIISMYNFIILTVKSLLVLKFTLTNILWKFILI